ncbi:MAG: hypothetical protein GQ574_08255 [Crocinitomix sp.]|nr:hypothetical protein [Crocinitomix sp.]
MGKRIGKLNLVNYIDHPTNKDYRLFNFNTKHEADLFEKKLSEKSIWFERNEEDHEDAILYLFAVREREFGKAQDANFMVSAETRKNIIPNGIIRYLFLFIVFAIIAFAIVGYIKSQG